MTTETKPRARRRRTPQAPGAEPVEVSASEAREIVKPTEQEAEDPIEGEVVEEAVNLPAVTSATGFDAGTQALALLSDDEFESRMVMLKRGRERVARIQKELLVESTEGNFDGDYGMIPGTDKPTLFKSGAEKLCQFYGLVADITITFRAGDNVRTPPLIYDAVCKLHLGSTDGPIVATGYGTANSWEKRYLRGGQKVCPSCGVGALIVSKFRANTYHCFAKKGGCGQDVPFSHPEIMAQTDSKGAVTDAYDLGNTLAKMSEKRAYVDATLRATATSGLFTQDIVEETVNSEKPLDETTTVTPGGAILDASTGEVQGRVETVDMTGNPDEDHAAAGEVPIDEVPTYVPEEEEHTTAWDAAEKAKLEEQAPYVARGDEVEKVLRRPDPMGEPEPEFTPSGVEGVGRGGITNGSNSVQIGEVKRISKAHHLKVAGLINFMMDHGALDRKIGEAMLQIQDPKAGAAALETRLERLSGQQIGKLLHDMREVLEEGGGQ